MSYRNGKKMGKSWLLLGLIAFCSIGSHASTLPPDPDNAALLYYQAFLLRPEPDYVAKEPVHGTPAEQFYQVLAGGKLEFGTETDEQIRKYEKMLKEVKADPNTKLSEHESSMYPERNIGYLFERLSMLRKRREHEEKMSGVDPNEVIRKYMRDCREAIEVAQIASEMSECRWGFRYSEGNAFIMPLLIEIRELSIALHQKIRARRKRSNRQKVFLGRRLRIDRTNHKYRQMARTKWWDIRESGQQVVGIRLSGYRVRAGAGAVVASLNDFLSSW